MVDSLVIAWCRITGRGTDRLRRRLTARSVSRTWRVRFRCASAGKLWGGSPGSNWDAGARDLRCRHPVPVNSPEAPATR